MPSVVDVAFVKSPLVARSAVAKRLVEVAFVDVLLMISRFDMVDDAAFTRIPPVNERSVEVAFDGNGHENPVGHVERQVSPVRQSSTAENAVEDAYAKREAVDDVATMYATVGEVEAASAPLPVE